jgi:hypothetical protein
MKERIWWFLERLKKFFWCRFQHRRKLCHPEVWGRGLAGPWHCASCRPCGEIFDVIAYKPLKGWLWDQQVTLKKQEKRAS